MPSEARLEATDWIPGPRPLLGWGLPSQLPFHLAPVELQWQQLWS